MVWFFIVVICILVVAGIIMAAIIKNLSADNKELEKALEKQNKNVHFLLSYQEQFQELNKKNKAMWEQIKNAETDEDISNLLAGIVAGNNDRVSKHSN